MAGLSKGIDDAVLSVVAGIGGVTVELVDSL